MARRGNHRERERASQRVPRVATNRVVHETGWVCWAALGGCGHYHGLNFAGGACTECGAFLVMQFKLVDPCDSRPA